MTGGTKTCMFSFKEVVFKLLQYFLRLRSNCTILLVQHIVDFSLIKQEQRGHGKNK